MMPTYVQPPKYAAPPSEIRSIYGVWQGYIEEWVVSGYELTWLTDLNGAGNVGTAFRVCWPRLIKSGANMEPTAYRMCWRMLGSVGLVCLAGRAGDGVDQTFDFVTGLGDSLSCGLGDGSPLGLTRQ